MSSFDELAKVSKPKAEKKPFTKGDYEKVKMEVEEHLNGNLPEYEPVEEEEQPQKKSYKERVAERMQQQKSAIAPKKKRRIRMTSKAERMQKKQQKPVVWEDEEEPDEEQEYPSEPPPKPQRMRRGKSVNPKKKDYSRYKAITMMTAFAVMFFIFMYTYLPEGDPQKMAMFEIMILLGLLLFLPVGMLIGWGMLDPYMRCRLMRKMTKKNYGVIGFVSKGKRMVTHIKNFDDALLWVKNKCWAVKKSRIVEVDKYGERISEGTNIDPDDFIIMSDTVPMLFIDVDNMTPLTLHETTDEAVTPDELGPALKGWVDNQQAKLMFMKRTMEMYYLVIIILVMGSAFFGYQNNQQLTEIQQLLESIKQRMSTVTPPELLSFINFFGF